MDFASSPALITQMMQRRTQMSSYGKATTRWVVILTGIGAAAGLGLPGRRRATAAEPVVATPAVEAAS
jgi:hypothetical protein